MTAKIRANIGMILILSAVLLLAIWLFCRKDYDKSFDGDFPDGIEFGMSKDEIVKVNGYLFTSSTYDNCIEMNYGNGVVFRLDNDKLTSIRETAPEEQALALLSKYGVPDKEKRGLYSWYGKVGETKCTLRCGKEPLTGFEIEFILG